MLKSSIAIGCFVKNGSNALKFNAKVPFPNFCFQISMDLRDTLPTAALRALQLVLFRPELDHFPYSVGTKGACEESTRNPETGNHICFNKHLRYPSSSFLHERLVVSHWHKKIYR